MVTEKRYTATNLLRVLIDSQGLRHRWVAAQAGISTPFLSLILSQHRRTSEAVAARLAEIVGAPVLFVFECSDKVSESDTNEEAA